MKEKQKEKKKKVGRPKKMTLPVVETPLTPEKSMPENTTPEPSIDRSPEEYKALLDLIGQDRDKLQGIALDRLKAETIKAVQAFAMVDDTARKIGVLFDDSFNQKVKITLLTYFKALYERVFGEELPQEALKKQGGAKKIDLIAKEEKAPGVEAPTTPTIKKERIVGTKDTTNYTPNQGGGNNEKYRIKRSGDSGVQLGSKVASSTNIDGVAMGKKTTAATGLTTAKKTAEATSVVSDDVVCLNETGNGEACGWEGTESQCKKINTTGIVRLVCPQCNKPLPT